MSVRANYGIDAPQIVKGLLSRGLMCLVGGLAAFTILSKSRPELAVTLLRIGLWAGGTQIVSGWFMIWSSRVGKLWVVRKLIDSLPWRGDEQVLDIGCGRGIAMIAAANKLRSGMVTGIDVWKPEDLSGNVLDAAVENARIEGVADRVKVQTADARQLPFADASFDTVVSMTAIHNIKDAGERRSALAEILRVLKPGGHLAVFDVFHARSYATVLRELDATGVERSGLILLWCVPGYRVKARKVQ